MNSSINAGILISVLISSCLVVSAAVLPEKKSEADELAHQFYLDNLQSAFRPIMTFKNRPGKSCILSPIVCQIEGYIEGKQSRVLGPVNDFVKGTVHFDLVDGKYVKNRISLSGANSWAHVQIWDTWAGNGLPLYVFVYGKTKAGKEQCVAFRAPALHDTNCVHKNENNYPFQTLNEKGIKVGNRGGYTFAATSKSLLTQANVEILVDPLPTNPKTKNTPFVPVYHTIKNFARKASASVGFYGANFFFTNCQHQPQGFSKGVWDAFPEICARIPDKDIVDPLRKFVEDKKKMLKEQQQQQKPKRSAVDEEDSYSHYESNFQEVVRQTHDRIVSQWEHHQNVQEGRYPETELPITCPMGYSSPAILGMIGDEIALGNSTVVREDAPAPVSVLDDATFADDDF